MIKYYEQLVNDEFVINSFNDTDNLCKIITNKLDKLNDKYYSKNRSRKYHLDISYRYKIYDEIIECNILTSEIRFYKNYNLFKSRSLNDVLNKIIYLKNINSNKDNIGQIKIIFKLKTSTRPGMMPLR